MTVKTNKIPFLDILLKRCSDNTFSTSVYRKKTFTGLYTKWDSFTPRKYKINLIRTLTYRCFRICSSPSLLQAAIKDLRKLLLQNDYPQGVITFNINDVLNKNKNKSNNPVQATVPKKDILIVLPFLGLHSNQVTKRLKSCVYNFYSFVNLKIIFQNTRRIKSFLTARPWAERGSCSAIGFLINLFFRFVGELNQTSTRPHSQWDFQSRNLGCLFVNVLKIL